jgi:hypothetical protein
VEASSSQDDGSSLWTVWLDYYATGEGRTQMAFIGYAEGEQEALSKFGKEFGEYFASGAEVKRGVFMNEVTRALFSSRVLSSVRKLEGRANVVLSASWHYNLA